jgi:purine-binding chemotaxis protein CheW
MVVFYLAGQACAVRLECVREIVPFSQLSCPPGMPSLLQGFLNLAGTAVPVLRLDRLFGMTEQPIELFTPMIVVDSGTGLLALLVERVSEVLVAVPETGSEKPLHVEAKDTFKGCVSSVIHSAGQDIHVLALDRIMLEQERQCVADFQSREQHRLKALAEVGP